MKMGNMHRQFSVKCDVNFKMCYSSHMLLDQTEENETKVKKWERYTYRILFEKSVERGRGEMRWEKRGEDPCEI
jgi:hypothetical protein